MSPICHCQLSTLQIKWRSYLACYSQEEIAAVVDVPKVTVSDKISKLYDLGNLAKSVQTLANHEDQDF